MLRAYQNCLHTKEWAVQNATAHRVADHYRKGFYKKGEGDTFKGCSIGCTADGVHANMETWYGIDRRIGYLQDKIFEGLKEPLHLTFTEDVYQAIPEGADTAQAFYRFMARLILDEKHGLIVKNNAPAIKTVGELYQRAASGDVPSKDEWAEASAEAAWAWAWAWAAWAWAAAARFKHYEWMRDVLLEELAREA